MGNRSSETAGSRSEDRSRFYFATNRANVLPILSSGLIRPRAAYAKYYADFLEHCPGLIPLFPYGVPTSLLSLLSSGEPGMFPVLVELDPKKMMSRPRLILDADCKAIDADAVTGGHSILCSFVGSPIPFAAVRVLHFINEENREDFEARDFDNVLPLPPLQVTPTAFIAGGPDPAHFASALGGLQPARGGEADFRRLDAAMGAVAVLSHLLPTSKAWLDALAAAVNYPQPEQSLKSSLAPWIGTVVAMIMSVERRDDSECGVDLRLIRAAVDFLRSSSPGDGWVEAKVAAEIASRASAGAPATDAKEIESWKDVVTAVSKAEKQAGSLDDMRSLVRRALMLLVLRCTPERIAKASETPLRPGPQVAAIAGMLSGIFQGYSRLSRDLKTHACSPEVLSRLAVCWWSPIDGEARKLAVGTALSRDDQITARISVTVGPTKLVDRVFRLDDSMMRLFYHAKSVGYSLEYDPTIEAFVHQAVSEKGTSRRVIVEAGRPTPRGHGTIRIKTTCVTTEGKPIRLSKREDAIALLERNHDPDIQCRFAVEPMTGNIQVLVHQMLETLDSPELQAHMDSVVRTANEFEEFWAARIAAEPPRTRKSRSQKPNTSNHDGSAIGASGAHPNQPATPA